MLQIYSLKITSILGLEADSEKAMQIDSLLDSERLAIVKRTSANLSGCATARGAGLLLQYVGQLFLCGKINVAPIDINDASSTDTNDASNMTALTIKSLDIERVLDSIDNPIDFKYEHGADGKPYWKDERLPFFNISHSDGTVVLVISDVETGIDIQKIKSKNELSMAERFYSENEARLVEESSADNYELFYKLWARKEALGKCTGRGVRPYLDTDVSDMSSDYMKQYRWLEGKTDDCFVCVCSKI